MDSEQHINNLDLRPREFGVALLMAAGWYFFGAWGLIPTIWFVSLILHAQADWLNSGMRLLPVAQRRALIEGIHVARTHWQHTVAPWREHRRVALPMPTSLSGALNEEDQLRSLQMLTIADLAASENLLIVGNRGSGKTTLLQAIVAQRKRRTYVIDPHNHPGKWPEDARVIGGGRNFATIYDLLLRSEVELNRRAKMLNTHAHSRFSPFSIVSDEWGAVTSEIAVDKDREPPGRLILRLLKEGRKFGISFIACAHGDTAESLGSRGDTIAFRTSFDWIVYCGAFVSRQLKDLPALLQSLPLGRTSEGGTFPLLVIAVSLVTGERRLLDLRTIPQDRREPQHTISNVHSQAITLTENILDSPEQTSNYSALLNGISAHSPIHPMPDEQPAELESVASNETNESSLPTPTELRALGKALQIYARQEPRKSKQRAIIQAFGCRPGGSEEWRRASLLFDEVVAGFLEADPSISQEGV